jgi:hypothetical protein
MAMFHPPHIDAFPSDVAAFPHPAASRPPSPGGRGFEASLPAGEGLG